MAEDPNVQRIRALARQAARDRPELLAQDPWVGEDPHPDGERILIGRRVFSRSRAGWMVEPERVLWAIDGLWALEALTGIQVASLLPAEKPLSDETAAEGFRGRSW